MATKKPAKSFIRRIFSSKKRIAAIVFVIAISFFAYSRLTAEPEGLETYVVRRWTLSTGLTANGEVKADSVVDLKFYSPGKVSWLGVKKGDWVNVGQAVAKLDTVMLNATYQQAQNSYRDAQANVE